MSIHVQVGWGKKGGGISREGDRSFAAVKEGKHISRDMWEAELTEGLGETTLAATKLSTREVLHSTGSRYTTSLWSGKLQSA